MSWPKEVASRRILSQTVSNIGKPAFGRFPPVQICFTQWRLRVRN
ncbi:hypothetical protein AB395_00001763 [Sinorhizobium fredii CCBAU 45436]|nr:hypothetical protein SF83666_c17200 [Sinorhizobium fredii CCBAU 83666]AWI57417.1 hypothetical protein AB395_00001763 [Sinorhizobium fredii CCBAU 45436]AWM25273.1 hypothetical protein AOX55_00002021 [Sinorhizobium fredii CCBAU 25509]